MVKMGRPRIPEGEKVVIVRLARKHIGMIDEAVLLRTAGATLGTRRATGEPEGNKEPAGPEINWATERRKVVTELIKAHLSESALYPTKVGLLVPMGKYSDEDWQTINEWAGTQGEKLLDGAPTAVRIAIEENRLRRIALRKTGKEYLRHLQRATRQEPAQDGHADRNTG